VKIDTSLGYDYWIDVLASVRDNPLDSIHNEHDLTIAIANAFDKPIETVKGARSKHVLFNKVAPNWEIVSE
jgi:hypothetical protein